MAMKPQLRTLLSNSHLLRTESEKHIFERSLIGLHRELYIMYKSNKIHNGYTNRGKNPDDASYHIPSPPIQTVDRHSHWYQQLTRMFQGNDLKNPRATTKVRIGLLLNRSKMVRLTIMDNVSAQFRDLHSMTVMKYKVVIITSINPRVFKGKLILATTPATRFYCDSTIDLIQSFVRRNKVSNHS
ncbi:hypothetical protein HID58_013414 [Brassica napus]|uniref:Uncharacterized protein n=3 Tax=Brassica TaxID=3705 RepID=A0ABQ8E3V2_BRANA|nr:hypothetical protein HID58_013414 [Brassica napus]CAG7885443.1 unnamed protein product [Brassica rapa]